MEIHGPAVGRQLCDGFAVLLCCVLDLEVDVSYLAVTLSLRTLKASTSMDIKTASHTLGHAFFSLSGASSSASFWGESRLKQFQGNILKWRLNIHGVLDIGLPERQGVMVISTIIKEHPGNGLTVLPGSLGFTLALEIADFVILLSRQKSF